MEMQDLLQSAVLAARAGQRQSARALFLEAAEQDPGCELAWLWLGELQERPADRIRALERALQLRPSNQRAAQRLQKLREMYIGLHEVASQAPQPDQPAFVTTRDLNSMLPAPALLLTDELAAAPLTSQQDQPVYPYEAAQADTQLARIAPQADDEEQAAAAQAIAQAKRLVQAGQIDSALSLLYQLVEGDPRNTDAWLLIAEFSPRGQEKISALRKAAEIQPNDPEIRAHLQRFEALEREPLLVGLQHEERGEREQAMLVYEWIKVHSRSATERMEAARRMDNLRISEEAERLHRVSPNISLLRLTIGPAVLFGLLIFIQSGLNPLKLPLVSLLGQASVLAGSLLVNVTSLRPMHPRWVQLFGHPGTPRELEMRSGLRLLGWALLLAPYVLFLIEALHRLQLFRAAMDY